MCWGDIIFKEAGLISCETLFTSLCYPTVGGFQSAVLTKMPLWGWYDFLNECG